jgi:hypothetical protein
MSISNKKKIKLEEKQKNKKSLFKRFVGLIMFCFGVIISPLIIILLLFNKKTDLSFYEKLKIMLSAYKDFLLGNFEYNMNKK